MDSAPGPGFLNAREGALLLSANIGGPTGDRYRVAVQDHQLHYNRNDMTNVINWGYAAPPNRNRR